MIALKMDGWIVSKLGMYKRMSIDHTKSAQAMAGFSSHIEVQEAIDKTHADLIDTATTYLKTGSSILDIGCGAGAYLKHFTDHYNATGIDLNTDMIEVGKKTLPKATFIHADFIQHTFTERFDFIYSISVLEFIAPSTLNTFFKKIHDLLNPGGIFFLHYPHALNYKSTLYPDLYYIEYAPTAIEKKTKRYFNIITHKHGFDNRKVTRFDTQPYGNGKRIFKNGYLLVAQKATIN